MAYETGGATSPGDLIDKIRVFAAGNGWTVDYSGTFAGGAGATCVLLHKGALHVGFFANTGSGNSADPGPYAGASHYPGPYDGAKAADAQSGIAPITYANKMAGPYQAYHLFAGDDYLHCAVEATPGSYRHFGAGQLERAGGVTTGAYAYGLRWNYSTTYVNDSQSQYHMIPFDDYGAQASGSTKGMTVRADSDAQAPRNAVILDYTGTAGGSGWGGYRRSGGGGDHSVSPLNGLIRSMPSTLTGRAALLPCMLAVHRPSGMLSLLGSPRDLRFTRIDNLAPGDLITIGADTWKIFPIIRKNGPAGQENSNNYAYAYRIVA